MLHSPYSSRSSLPTVSRDADDDSTDEILVFAEEEEGDEDTPGPLILEDEYDYGLGLRENLPQGYSIKELEQMVTFVRSSKDANTGNFDQEQKTMLWCIQNGCEEAQPGVWSGCWYFTYLSGEAEGRQAWLEAQNKRMVKESGGRGRKVPNDDYGMMVEHKEKGKRAFYRGQYKTALDYYVKAEELMGGHVSGIYLIPSQRAEMVTVLSNQAECFLRLKKYESAIMQTTKALQLDRRHSKSLLRRAKATISLCTTLKIFPVPSVAVEDLQILIEMKGEGVHEAHALLENVKETANLPVCL